MNAICKYPLVALVLGGATLTPATAARAQAAVERSALPLATTPPAPTATPSIPQPGGDLGELDALFLNAYRERRSQIKVATDPVIVVSGSSLILYRLGKPEEKPVVIPKIYHELKSIAHLPFTLYLLLSPFADVNQDISAGAVDRLKDVGQKTAAVQATLPQAGFSEVQRARQVEILSASAALVQEVLTSKRISRARLLQYSSMLGGVMLANADEAGCAQIRGTHTQVMEWKKALTADEWKRLRVTNRGKHQARYRNAATQYFAWLLGDPGIAWGYPGESMRLVYVEFLGKVADGKDEDSRDVLGTIVVDADASQAFFGDPWRLSVDILADGAKRCVEEIAKGSGH